jgi:electron transport complex protein RnfE
MGIPREVLGNGTFLGVHVMPHAFEPWVVMLLPPGGFFMIGVLLLVVNWHDLRKLARERAATPAAVAVVASPPKTPEREAALV